MKNTINGTLMSRDSTIATISNNIIVPQRENLLPLYFQQEGATLNEWLKMRSIDTGRVNSRLIRKSLGLSDASAEELVLSVNAAMITDTYWIKPDGSTSHMQGMAYKPSPIPRVFGRQAAASARYHPLISNACCPGDYTISSIIKIWSFSILCLCFILAHRNFIVSPQPIHLFG